jgi:hypothetical protein
MQKIDCLIISPGFSFHNLYVSSLIKSIKFLQNMGISVEWMSFYAPILSATRQHLLYSALSLYDFNKLIFIDSDISWDEKDIYNIYNSKKDAVSAIYFNLDKKIPAKNLENNYFLTKNNLKNQKEPFKISYCGLAFFCIKKEIINKIEEPFLLKEKPLLGNIGNYLEDFIFCKNLRNLGFDIWLDPNIKVKHHKTVEISWDSV